MLMKIIDVLFQCVWRHNR